MVEYRGFAADVLCINLLGTPSTPGSFIHVDKASNFTLGLIGTPNGIKNKLLMMDPKLITSDLIEAIEDEGLPDPDEVIKQMEAIEDEGLPDPDEVIKQMEAIEHENRLKFKI